MLQPRTGKGNPVLRRYPVAASSRAGRRTIRETCHCLVTASPRVPLVGRQPPVRRRAASVRYGTLTCRKTGTAREAVPDPQQTYTVRLYTVSGFSAVTRGGSRDEARRGVFARSVPAAAVDQFLMQGVRRGAQQRLLLTQVGPPQTYRSIAVTGDFTTARASTALNN
jgi:hypothetical protein